MAQRRAKNARLTLKRLGAASLDTGTQDVEDDTLVMLYIVRVEQQRKGAASWFAGAAKGENVSYRPSNGDRPTSA